MYRAAVKGLAMNIGVVGTGMIAQSIVPHLGEWDISVNAVCSTPRSVDKAQALAEPYAAATYTDYDAMLADPTVDTVYVALPNDLHADRTLRALEANKNVIVEKPFAVNTREAEKMAALARAKNLFVFEAITTRYLPNFKTIRKLLNRIGKVRLVMCNYSQYSSRYDAFRAGTILPAFDPIHAGGALMDLGLYNMHYLVGLFGEPRQVHYEANIERDIDTSGVAVLDYGSFKAVAACAKDCAAPLSNTIQGNDGYILQTTPTGVCGEILLHLNDGTEERFDDNPEIRWESEFRAFAKAINEGNLEACYSDLDETLAVVRVMTKARQSAGVVFPMDEE